MKCVDFWSVLSGFLGGLQSTAFSYDLVKGEVFHLQQFLDDFSVEEVLDDLVTYSLLEAVIVAEVACLGEVVEIYKTVIK